MTPAVETQPPVVGAAPEGANDAQSAARAVREMFTSIAPRYDLLNHVLSCNVDRLWWWRAARTFSHVLSAPDARVLDLCCGTGDLTFALRKQAGKNNPQILGADFSHAMLQRARAKSLAKTGNGAAKLSNERCHPESRRSSAEAKDLPLHDHSAGAKLHDYPKTADNAPGWIEADALSLPFPNEYFNLVTSAFGFRNLANYDAGLREIARILNPNGECGILDFSEPDGVMGQLYRVYFKRVLPAIGTLISGVSGPYAYLPNSVERFPKPEEMLDRMRHAGFREASWTPYTFGIAGLYRGKK